ncbi:NUDIX hydrolase [Actinomadura flavalba]|uniref:NUDIX hydrolase n=1 Tax=Actinomadura flavalba TaxID=1120938 RepID=UPI0003634E75|nr:NUDIX domain-containing protein [Actinomadura flavalba]
MRRDVARHSVSVTGVVRRADGRVLAIRRADDGRWVPPGGVLELDEAPEAGVAREVLEETGVEVEVGRLTGVYKNMRLGVVTLAFLCRPIGGVVSVTDEALDVAWLTLDESVALMPEARAVRVTDALCAGGPFVRVHDGTRVLHGQAPRRP